MALIDRIMPLTTLVIFMGGNSGQMIVNILQRHSSFSNYDHVPIDKAAVFKETFTCRSYTANTLQGCLIKTCTTWLVRCRGYQLLILNFGYENKPKIG